MKFLIKSEMKFSNSKFIRRNLFNYAFVYHCSMSLCFVAAKYYQNAIFDVEWIPGERYHLLAASATPGISCFDMTRDLPNQDTG